MSSRAQVAVVGTGVVGLAVALELAGRGMSVAAVGPRGDVDAGSGSRAAGAMLSTFSELELQHDGQRAAVETAERLAAHEMYPAWLDKIASCGGGVVEAPAGTWVLAPAGRAPALAPIAAAARAAGHGVEEHDAAAVPGLSAPAQSAAALWLPTERRVDACALLAALTAALAGNACVSWSTAPAVSVESGGVRCSDGSLIQADVVVLAAGCGIPALLSDGGAELGVPPILAGRGVSTLLDAPAVKLPHVVRTPNAAFACGVHLVPRADGLLYLGGTNRLTLAADAAVPPMLDEVAVLAADGAGLLDGRLAAAGLVGVRVGFRPYTLDHLPLIGRTGDPAVLLATATYRCGVLLAPRLAHLIAEEIASPGALDSHPYRAGRAMPAPQFADLAGDAGRALLEHLLQGGGLSAAARGELAAFASLALRALLDDQSPAGSPVRRLWHRAPVIEAVPALFGLARRLEETS